MTEAEDDIGDHLSLQPYRLRLPNGCRLTFDLFEDMVVVSPDYAACRKGGVGGPETLDGAFGPVPPYADAGGGDPVRTWPLLYSDADRRLNGVWKALQGRIPAAQKPALLAQQRRWIARRDQVCLTYKGTAFHPKCLANITEGRATWLNAQARSR
ncbi:lysozyme inhibitor LprI family protein [Sphingopyxis sp. PET50]|uniref:lysozyme inhibitor LprI family protein n=1 Tax=Sphingopyxis sp. PET50 TaxID=2976533 RepID=UPI0021AEBE9F|nr:lysozyme inhibitor LprI family protein [Sphingopyxis sp. PET50]